MADANLRTRLDQQGRLAYDAAREWGATSQPPFIVEAALDEPVADPLLLELSEGLGAPVLSNDKFEQWRAAFPWLQGSTDRVLGWVATQDGLEVHPRELRRLESYEISRAKAEDYEKRFGITPDIKRHHYRCTNPTCSHYRVCPSRLLVLPKVSFRRGTDPEILCPGCGEEVETTGDRADALFFKLSAGDHVERFGVEEGASYLVGRNYPITLSRWLRSDARHISRHHLEINVRDGTGFLKDLGSENGSVLHRKDGKHRTLRPSRPPLTLNAGEFVMLAACVRIERSGYRVLDCIPDGYVLDREQTSVVSRHQRLVGGGSDERDETD